MTEEEKLDALCEWCDYRKAYGVSEQEMNAAKQAFMAGYEAAKGTSYEDILR